jgi:hypothetical protein
VCYYITRTQSVLSVIKHVLAEIFVERLFDLIKKVIWRPGKNILRESDPVLRMVNLLEKPSNGSLMRELCAN